MTDAPLYLASTSPRRRQLLSDAAVTFQPYAAPVDEERLTEGYAGPLLQLGEFLAQRKAEAAAYALTADGKDGLVLAADTTVLIDGRSLAKPLDADEALVMLRMLRGRTHIVATGVAVVELGQRRMTSATSATSVTMRDYAEADLAAYVRTGDPLDKAGAYSIQHPQFSPVAAITGCHLGVIGLPMCLAGTLAGVTPPCQPADPAAICPFSARCTAPLPPADGYHHAPLRDAARGD